MILNHDGTAPFSSQQIVVECNHNNSPGKILNSEV